MGIRKYQEDYQRYMQPLTRHIVNVWITGLGDYDEIRSWFDDVGLRWCDDTMPGWPPEDTDVYLSMNLSDTVAFLRFRRDTHAAMARLRFPSSL